MDIVNIEASTFEAMLSRFGHFSKRMKYLCRLHGDTNINERLKYRPNNKELSYPAMQTPAKLMQPPATGIKILCDTDFSGLLRIEISPDLIGNKKRKQTNKI